MKNVGKQTVAFLYNFHCTCVYVNGNQWELCFACMHNNKMQFTHIVSLGARSSRRARGSTRSTGSWETRSTSNTSSTLQNITQTNEIGVRRICMHVYIQYNTYRRSFVSSRTIRTRSSLCNEKKLNYCYFYSPHLH